MNTGCQPGAVLRTLETYWVKLIPCWPEHEPSRYIRIDVRPPEADGPVVQPFVSLCMLSVFQLHANADVLCVKYGYIYIYIYIIRIYIHIIYIYILLYIHYYYYVLLL